MKEKTLKDLIAKLVSDRQGLKGTELAMLVSAKVHEDPAYSHLSVSGDSSVDDYLHCLKEMVDNEDLVEVEYVLPNMKYRTKSFYLPKDTQVEISKTNLFTD